MGGEKCGMHSLCIPPLGGGGGGEVGPFGGRAPNRGPRKLGGKEHARTLFQWLGRDGGGTRTRLGQGARPGRYCLAQIFGGGGCTRMNSSLGGIGVRARESPEYGTGERGVGGKNFVAEIREIDG